MITLSPEDRAQVHAIMMTHAEMQDARVNDSMAVLGRLKCDEPEAVDMIEDLEAMIEICEEDSDSLKRIAGMFGEV